MRPIFNRAPLTPNNLAPLPLGSIRPEGWLLEVMQAQRTALAERLEALWPENGTGRGWYGMDEGDLIQGPTLLDGVIALAWTLNDEALKARCARAVEWILSSQREDGWFGPEGNEDYWPLMLALRALRQYFTATGERRVLVLMDRFFKYQYANLAVHPLRDAAVARGGENMESVLWLYNITGQKHLIELCRRLRDQTLDWPSYFHTFANTVPMSKSLTWERLSEALKEESIEPLEGIARPYFKTQYHLSQGTDIAMGLKTPGVINLFKSGFKEQGGFRFGWGKLVKHHGLANGMYTCDGHLNGANPSQGSMLSAVAELMRSLESLIALGDFNPECADVLEKLAYNALPAGVSEDMTAFQSTQQVNQVRLSADRRKWYNQGEDANLFKPLCDSDCAAACQQAWPGFAASQWYQTTDDGLQAISYAPCTVRAVLSGVPVRLKISGRYPFSDEIEITVSAKQPCEFPLYLRIPYWTRQAMIHLPDGEIMQVRANETTCVRRRWHTGDVVHLELPTMPRVTKWYHQSGAVELGALLMALPLKPRTEEDEAGNACIVTESPWNWALVRDEPMKVMYAPDAHAGFGAEDGAVRVRVKAVPVEWPMDGQSAAAVPMVPTIDPGRAQVIELVPYGATLLRIAQFPIGRGQG